MGMSNSTLERIFDPFFTTKTSGHGLGLSATLGIIRAHNGGLQVESKIGEGSQFRVLFPISEQAPIELPIVPQTLAKPVRKATVLIVDDEKLVRQVATEGLKVMGLNVLSAKNGQEALDIYQAQEEIDVIILDMKMPVMDGVETYRRLKQMGLTAKVIICSGFSEAEALDEVMRAGNVGYLAKPYGFKDMSAKVLEMLEQGTP
jgi:CheY-like chemotaxis protein